MLPFLKKNIKPTGISMIVRSPDEGKEESMDMLETAMADLADAMEAKDSKRMAAAFRAAFEMLEMEPHEEYPHEE